MPSSSRIWNSVILHKFYKCLKLNIDKYRSIVIVLKIERIKNLQRKSYKNIFIDYN